MSDNDRLHELAIQWQEFREQGQEVSPEKMCAGCPQLLQGLLELLRKLVDAEYYFQLDPIPYSFHVPDPVPQVAGYSICSEPLGIGGMGVVYRAHQGPTSGKLDLERDVALKVLQERRYPSGVDRFIKEANTLAQLQHPGIVPVYALGRMDDGRPFFTMKLVEGETLWQRLAKRPPCAENWPYYIGIFEQICRTVAFAHGKELLHRDLKPANIMVGALEEIQVMDWGLVKILQTDVLGESDPQDNPNLAVNEGTIGPVGTRAYMSPEQAWGNDLSTRTDVFGLGAILCEILTGSPPYVGGDLMEKARRGDLDDCRYRLNKCGADEELIRIALSCLAKNPDERPADAKVVAAQVATYRTNVQKRLEQARLDQVKAQGEQKTLAAEIARLEVEKSRAQIRRRAFWLLGGLLLALFAGAAIFVYFTIIIAIENELKGQLQEEKNRADQKADEASTNEKEARAQKGDADRQRQKVQALNARITLERDLRWCEAGNISVGLLLLARGLERARDLEDIGLEQPLRRLVNGWAPVFHPLKVLIPHPDPIKAVVLSSDGQTIATCSKEYAYLWKTATGEAIIKLAGHTEEVIAVAFSTDNGKLLTGSRDKTARLWNTATGKPIGEPLQHPGAVTAVAFSPDGHMFCTGSVGACQRWQAVNAQPIGKPLPCGGFAVQSIAFSPNGKVVATANRHDFQANVQMWDPVNGNPIGAPLEPAGPRTITIPTSGTNDFASIAFSPDSKTIVTVWDNAYLWDTATGKPKGVAFKNPGTGLMQTVAMSPDGSTILTGNNDVARAAQLWDAATGKQVGKTLPHLDAVKTVAFSPDGKLAVTGSDDHTARVWDAVTGEPVGAPLRHEKEVRFVTFSPDGKTILTSSQDRTVRVWSVESSERIEMDSGYVGAAAFSSDGRFLAAGGRDAFVRLLDGETGAPVAAPLWHDRPVSALAFRADGKLLVTGTSGGGVRFWNAASGTPASKPLQHPPQKTSKVQKENGEILTFDQPSTSIEAVAFSPDGKTAASASNNNTVQIWDVATATAMTELLRHDAQVFAVAFSPDSKIVFSGSGDHTVRRWDAATGQPAGEAIRHPDLLWAMALSPDGNTLLTAGGLAKKPSASRLWKLPGGEPLTVPLRHQGRVLAAAFSPDGKTVLTGSDDGVARLWDASTGAPVSDPLHHQGPVTSVAFSKDGVFIATGSADGMIRLWDATTGWAAGDRHTRYSVQALALHPHGKSVAAGTGKMEYLDNNGIRHWGEICFWRLPVPLGADIERITLWIQVNTGMELDHRDQPVLLSEAALRERWRDLEKRGGPPRRYAAVFGPPNAYTLFLQGKKHSKLKNYDKAIEALSEAIRLDPKYADAYNLRGLVRQQRKEYKEALEDFTRAIEIDPDGPDIFYENRANAYAELTQWAKAIPDIAKAISLQPKDSWLYSRLALLYLQVDDMDSYRKTCETMLARFVRTKEAAVANNVAWTGVPAPKAIADPAKLVELAERAVAANPNNPNTLNTFGAALYRAGKFETAILRLNDAVKASVGIDKPHDWLFLAMAHHQLGHAEEARKWLDKADRWIDQAEQRKTVAANLPLLSWSVRLELRLLRRESHELFKGASVPKASP